MNQTKRQNSLIAWIVLSFAVAGFCMLVLYKAHETFEVQQRAVQAASVMAPTPRTFTLPGVKIKIFALPTKEYKGMGTWAITSKTSPLATDYQPKDLVNVGVASVDPKIQVSQQIDQPLTAMFAAAKNDGILLIIRSGYRSPAEQSKLLAAAGSDEFTARPGDSEHQTGLAVDINTKTSTCTVDVCSLGAKSASWLATNAHKYGFVQRYLPGKESITGLSPENWHYRYVGVPLATALCNTGITLEEAMPYITGIKR